MNPIIISSYFVKYIFSLNIIIFSQIFPYYNLINRTNVFTWAKKREILEYFVLFFQILTIFILFIKYLKFHASLISVV